MELHEPLAEVISEIQSLQKVEGPEVVEHQRAFSAGAHCQTSRDDGAKGTPSGVSTVLAHGSYLPGV
jgi:hypothetical protein